MSQGDSKGGPRRGSVTRRCPRAGSGASSVRCPIPWRGSGVHLVESRTYSHDERPANRSESDVKARGASVSRIRPRFGWRLDHRIRPRFDIWRLDGADFRFSATMGADPVWRYRSVGKGGDQDDAGRRRRRPIVDPFGGRGDVPRQSEDGDPVGPNRQAAGDQDDRRPPSVSTRRFAKRSRPRTSLTDRSVVDQECR